MLWASMRFGWGNTLPILLLAGLPLVAIATGAANPAHDLRGGTTRVVAPDAETAPAIHLQRRTGHAAGTIVIVSAANTANEIRGR
jgi:hypothetical protein